MLTTNIYYQNKFQFQDWNHDNHFPNGGGQVVADSADEVDTTDVAVVDIAHVSAIIVGHIGCPTIM